ncbi:MAG: copper chaperone CopZ [Anaerovoracaceae bacterium]|jgi:copper chaperone
MEKIILNVEGMSCSHCVDAVSKAVNGLDGVSSVDVQLEEKTVTVEFDASQINLNSIKEAIEDQGYDVV